MYNIIYDLDDTLITCDSDYNIVKKHDEEIAACNELHKRGLTIIIHTGRNWDKYEKTISNLKEAKIKYHQLVMGKPQGYYIDSTFNLTSGKELL